MNKGICKLCKKKFHKNIAFQKWCSGLCRSKNWYIKNLRDNAPSFYLNKKAFFKTETGKGFFWEKWSAKELDAKHLPFNTKGADLQKGDIFIDVKMAKINRRKNKRGKPVKGKQIGYWSFKGDNKYIPPANFFFCIGLGDNNEPEKVFLIPNCEYAKHGISIGRIKSKFDKFLYTKSSGLKNLMYPFN